LFINICISDLYKYTTGNAIIVTCFVISSDLDCKGGHATTAK
jgi:hypothetical protein